MPWLGTFHAICVKLLRRHAELVGLKSNFTILDTDDQVRLLKQLIIAANIDEKRWPAAAAGVAIDNWKNRAWTPDKVPAPRLGLQPAGCRALCGVSGAPEGPERGRFRRPACCMWSRYFRNIRMFWRNTSAGSLHPGGRISGYQRRAVPLAAAAGGRPQEHLLRRR